MGEHADKLKKFLDSQPSRAAVIARAAEEGVPPSLRGSRPKAIEALRSIISNEETHDNIARLASGVGRKEQS